MSNCRKQIITETLTENYMPYAMSVIVSRAIPEIDGFKPAHRKLLYTMYKMGLLNGNLTKSANIVGQTMKLNPHGDQAIYETMVRLSTGNETLMMPFVQSKGNFGKVYSRDMAYAASRYTEAKLTLFCEKLFDGIDKNAVDMVDNYDGTMKEPALFPTAFPNILVSPNTGIAVGMASSFCGFNLAEVCNATLAYMKNPKVDLLSILPGPDFTTGGTVISSKEALASVYQSGQGSIRVKGTWKYIKNGNLVEITEIPYSTTIEAIIDKIAELVKIGKLEGIIDVRDESDLNGLKIAIEFKKNADYTQIMKQIERQTPLVDNVSCNFNMLINGRPRVLGIKDILKYWVEWRINTKRRVALYEIEQKTEKLHLLQGLEKILLNINKAIKIIQQTEKDAAVIGNLMKGFAIDESQAQFIAEMKLRNINKEYIIKKTAEIKILESEILLQKDISGNEAKLKEIIATELKDILKKYSSPRRTLISYDEDENISMEPKPYQCVITIDKTGYLQKRTNDDLSQCQCEDNKNLQTIKADNRQSLLVFTNEARVYKWSISEIPLTGNGTSVFIQSQLKMDQGELVSAVFLFQEDDFILFLYQNGKIASVSMKAYVTKGNRQMLKNAFCLKSPLVAAIQCKASQLVLCKTETTAVAFHCSQVPSFQSPMAQGVQCIKGLPISMEPAGEGIPSSWIKKTLPSVGVKIKEKGGSL